MTRKPNPDGALARELAKVERKTISDYLKRYDGHLGRAATALGLSYRAMTAKVTAYGLQAEAAARRAEKGIGGPRGG